MKLLTASEVAEILRVDRTTVYDWARGGRLPFVSLSEGTVRFVEEEIKQFIISRSRPMKAANTPVVNNCEQKSPLRPSKATHPTKRRLLSR